MENEKEPGPKYLGEVIEIARKNNITTLFVEPQYNPKAAEAIAQEMNARIVTIDPLAGNYLDNMINASREIALSLT
jgi:zinc transport system substrate-binding protein